MKASTLFAFAAGAGVALIAERAFRSAPATFASLSGNTLAKPTAAAWMTDFLSAAYFAKPADQREVSDLRLAQTILTTYWNQQGNRPLGAADVLRFHNAFGTARLRRDDSGTGRLDTNSLLIGAARLFGDWFPDAYADWDRRGWGIVFPSVEAKAAYNPEIRLEQAKLGPLAPPKRPVDEQVWHTYPPVEVPDAGATAAAVLAVEHWPDYASELGRFTPLRKGGLAGQTFEIEVVGFPTPRTPIYTRAYVTITDLVTGDDQEALDAWVADVREGFAARPHELSPIPDDATVIAGFDLTCHQGHFMGDGKNRLVLYVQNGKSYLRAAGTWDPMQWHLAEIYDRVGQMSQHAFWGMGGDEESMLHQIADQTTRHYLPASK